MPTAPLPATPMSLPQAVATLEVILAAPNDADAAGLEEQIAAAEATLNEFAAATAREALADLRAFRRRVLRTPDMPAAKRRAVLAEVAALEALLGDTPTTATPEQTPA